MLGEARGESKLLPCMLYMYVNDTDAMYKRAIQTGAVSIMEPQDQFCGGRTPASHLRVAAVGFRVSNR